MYHATKIFILFTLVTLHTHARAAEPRLLLQLNNGIYKYLGHCKIPTNGIGLTLPPCLEYAGVIAKPETEEYQFLFPLQGRETLLYIARGPVELSGDGAVATYRVKELLDTASHLAYKYPAQCTMSARTVDPLIRCTTWKDRTKQSVLREVIFVGNGTWSFAPAISNP